MLRLVALLLLALLPAGARAQFATPFDGGGAPLIADCVFTSGASFNAATNTLTVGPKCPPILFNRGSAKYAFALNGLLTSYAADTPAVPVMSHETGAVLGLLIDGGVVVDNQYPRDLTRSAWVKVNASAALTQTGIDGAANSATLLTATGAKGSACFLPSNSTYQRNFTVYIKRVSGVGEVDISPDGITWTPVTGSLTSNGYTRVPSGGMNAISSSDGMCIRLMMQSDQVAVDYVNVFDDPNNTNNLPANPLLSTNGPASSKPDNAWIDLTKVPGWDPDHWTIVVESMMPVYLNPPGANPSSARAILSVDDGMGLNEFYLINQQDGTGDPLCNGVPPNLLHCPDWALIPNANGAGASTGKVRATYLPGSGIGIEALTPPGAGQFSAVAISYNRDNAVVAITVDNGGAGQTLTSGIYIPSGIMPVLTGLISPPYAPGTFKRLVIGGAPNEMIAVSGTATVGNQINVTGAWENPQDSQQTATVTYTELSTDTPTTMAAAIAAAITANSTFAASGISATASGGKVYPSHPPALFVTWSRTTSGTGSETVFTSGNAASYYGYFQRIRIYRGAMQNADLTSLMPPITPSRVRPAFALWNANGHMLLNSGGKLLCNHC